MSNSLLCGYVRNHAYTARELVCRWYNSLTLLMIELYIHSLGGGTLALIPGETDKMELLSDFPGRDTDAVFHALDQCALSDGPQRAYELGDEIVLRKRYGFTEDELSAIRASLSLLRSWRRPGARRGGERVTRD